MSIFTELIRTTARIETFDPKGLVSVGTSFFVLFDRETQPGFLLVTNRHVVEGKIAARVAISSNRDSTAVVEHVIVPQLQQQIVYHPDPDIDLAAIPWGGATSGIFQKGSHPGWLNIEEKYFLSREMANDLSPHETVAMIGYPNGIYDPFSNLPIIRSGNTATPIFADYLKKPQFLLNAGCFPGSNGSPVFLVNEGSYSTKDGFVVGSRVYLAGVLCATYTQELTGKIIRTPIPTSDQLMSVAQLPIHLGICIKASQISSIIDIARERAKNEIAA